MGGAPAPLRAVKPGERARRPRKDLTLSEAIARGTRRDVMVANRNLIVKALEEGKPTAAAVAALTKRLSELMNEIDAFDAQAKKGEDEKAGGSRDDVGDEDFDPQAV